MTIEDTPKSADPWHDDVLDRKTLGKVLEDHLINRFKAGNNGPLSLALDGRWGSGKSFFVERWTEQLKQNGRFVISFNAWQHDGAPEPSLALIGELRRQLNELSKSLDSTEPATELISSTMATAITSAKKAFKPMLTVAASGLLKRLIGSSLADFKNAMPDDDDGGPEPIEQATHSESRVLDKALDAYFDQALAGYELHQASIDKFHKDLGALADAVANTQNNKEEMIGPIIIIIDELDRCRPSFAVQLLEGIKHLFSVKNVCFLFATNLSQLTASIQVVYGTNFSGREYLGRFFDRELTLPAVTGSSFSKLLLQRPLPNSLKMGKYKVEGYEMEDQRLEFWVALSKAMNLTLRQQEQAFSILQTCCESYSHETPIPGVWLMFLSQLKTASPSAFISLLEHTGGSLKTQEFLNSFPNTNWVDKNLSSPWHRPSESHNPQLISLLDAFFKYSKLPRHLARNNLYSSNSIFADEIENFISSNHVGSNKTVLETTYDVVSAAGMFSY